MVGFQLENIQYPRKNSKIKERKNAQQKYRDIFFIKKMFDNDNNLKDILDL